MKRIYLDHAAGSPLRPQAREAMLPWLSAANPSSLHAPGRAARGAVDAARATVAGVLGARPREVIFTSGGSEAIALALFALARAATGSRRLVSSVAEHRATLSACEALQNEGWEIELLPVDANGCVDPGALARALRRPAALASLLAANNEIGTVAPVAELARIAHAHGTLLHVDAVQAPGALPCPVGELGADAVSFSAHKFGGPQGCGLLYVRAGVPFAPPLAGSQEHGRRPGTEGVAAIAGAAAALTATVAGGPAEAGRVRSLRERFEAGILGALGDVCINGSGAERLPGICSLSVRGAQSDELLVALDLAGIAASSGSACAAGSAEPSHVIRALGGPAWVARGVLRLSFGHTSTEEDAQGVLRMLPSIVELQRKHARVEVPD